VHQTLHNDVNYSGGVSRDLDLVFAALANRHRREIVEVLALQPASIQQLARRLGVSLTAIHRHIRVLEDALLIRRKKSGRVNFLAINRASLRRLQEWNEPFHAYWGSDEDSLENYIASIGQTTESITTKRKEQHR
jgi:DNA-binding transcriptional ArsR family regulator